MLCQLLLQCLPNVRRNPTASLLLVSQMNAWVREVTINKSCGAACGMKSDKNKSFLLPCDFSSCIITLLYNVEHIGSIVISSFVPLKKRRIHAVVLKEFDIRNANAFQSQQLWERKMTFLQWLGWETFYCACRYVGACPGFFFFYLLNNSNERFNKNTNCALKYDKEWSGIPQNRANGLHIINLLCLLSNILYTCLLYILLQSFDNMEHILIMYCIKTNSLAKKKELTQISSLPKDIFMFKLSLGLCNMHA